MSKGWVKSDTNLRQQTGCRTGCLPCVSCLRSPWRDFLFKWNPLNNKISAVFRHYVFSNNFIWKGHPLRGTSSRKHIPKLFSNGTTTKTRYIYICICIHIYIYICMYVCMYVYIYIQLLYYKLSTISYYYNYWYIVYYYSTLVVVSVT